MWITAALSLFSSLGSQEAGAARVQAAAIQSARDEQQKVYAMGAGLAAMGLVAVILMKKGRR